MSATVSKSIVDLLIAGGVESREEAAQLAQNLNGGSWTTQVLDSGKVDEQRFLAAIGNFFRVPVVTLDAKTIDRQTLSILPSRFVFQHHILPIAEKDNSVVLATYDLFNSAGRQLVTQLLKKPAEWVLVPRAQLLRVMKTLYGVGAETFDEILKTNRAFEAIAGIRDQHRPQRRRSGSFGRQIRQPNHPRSNSSNAPPIFTSSRWRTICAFAIGSMESCTKSRCRRNCACCNRPSFRV